VRLRTEMRVGLGAIMALQIATAVGAIGLLSRVSPGVKLILEENVPSIQSAETMMSAVARTNPSAVPTFREALARAEANITEPGERALIQRLREHGDAAVRGDPAARAIVLDTLAELTEINRDSMVAHDVDAQFLGTAGAWAMVVLGSLGFGLGIVVQRRLRERIELPVLRIDDTLKAARHGDEQRRCHQGKAPIELVRAADNLNWTLARLFERAQVSDPPDPDDRALALHLLDAFDLSLVVVTHDGRVVAMNRAAMRAGWDDDPQIARRLADAVASDTLLPGGWDATAIPNSTLVLCRKDQACDRVGDPTGPSEGGAGAAET